MTLETDYAILKLENLLLWRRLRRGDLRPAVMGAVPARINSRDDTTPTPEPTPPGPDSVI